MELTFLSGPIPLTKTITYSSRDDRYTVAPYPLVQKVTSHVEHVDHIHAFAAAIRDHGKHGHSLLKGHLARPLENETRAGLSVDQPHEWVVFDFDKINCAPTFEGALAAIGKYLPEECAHTSCVVQLSASCMRPDATHLSCHVFYMLEAPMSTQAMKDWITAINFDKAYDEITLNDAGMSLHFPIDISVVSPAKLIYIAPPRTVGFQPAFTDSVQVFASTKPRLAVAKYKAFTKSDISAHISTLRDAAGLPEWEYKTRHANGIDILVSPLEVHVHDVKPSGDGFIRFNMNGGDSYAYYIDLKKPGLIGNHKGEPFLQTEKVAKEFYKTLMKSTSARTQEAMSAPASIVPLAFYATNRDSTIFIGTYDRASDDLKLFPSKEGAAASWMKAYGVSIQSLPHYELVNDMTSDIRFEDGYPVINLYRQSDLIKAFASKPRTIEGTMDSALDISNHCPTLYKIMFSSVGSSTKAMHYLINWMAAVFQRRDRTLTGWVLHGVQGTGKGMFVEHIMKPMLGEQATTQQLYSSVEERFNGWLEGKLLVVFDEANINKNNWDQVRTKIYNWITESTVEVRDLNRSSRQVRNYANIIICSNDSRPIVIEAGDRRFNVGEYQRERLMLTAQDIAIIMGQNELAKLAEVLGAWQIDEDMLVIPYAGEAKQRIMDSTHSVLERTGRAILAGDVDYFIEVRPEEIQRQYDYNGNSSMPFVQYDQLIAEMMSGNLNVLGNPDLYVLFKVVAGNSKLFPDTKAAQKHIYQRFGLELDMPIRDKREGRTSTRGHKTNWVVTDKTRQLYAESFNKPYVDNVDNILSFKPADKS